MTPSGPGGSCWSSNGSTTTSPTSARCATTSATASSTPTPQRIREQLLRINDQVTGHRLLRGAVHPGGADLRQLPDPTELAAIAADIAEIVALALDHSVVRDRFTGTAVLTAEQARDLGTLGLRRPRQRPDPRRPPRPPHPGRTTPPHRAHPHRRRRARPVPRPRRGDHRVRRDDHRLVAQLDGRHRDTTPPSGTTTTAGEVAAQRAQVSASSRAGGARSCTASNSDADGPLTRVKIVDPSFFNWPALPVALADTIVPDFPLANKSFNLSYAGNDL